MSDDDAVKRLMKRCQIGVGGRNALDEAHSIMAECYGTLGSLAAEVGRQREVIGRLNAQCDHLGMRLRDVMAERDALRAAESRSAA